MFCSIRSHYTTQISNTIVHGGCLMLQTSRTNLHLSRDESFLQSHLMDGSWPFFFTIANLVKMNLQICKLHVCTTLTNFLMIQFGFQESCYMLVTSWNELSTHGDFRIEIPQNLVTLVHSFPQKSFAWIALDFFVFWLPSWENLSKCFSGCHMLFSNYAYFILFWCQMFLERFSVANLHPTASPSSVM